MRMNVSTIITIVFLLFPANHPQEQLLGGEPLIVNKPPMSSKWIISWRFRGIEEQTVHGRNPANQLRLAICPIIYEVL